MDTVLVRPIINAERNVPFFLPLGLLCISSALRRAGHAVRVLDFEFAHRVGVGDPPTAYLSHFSSEILHSNPAVVGLTALADSLPLVLLMARDLKSRQPNLIVVVGGPGVFGLLPDLAIRYSREVDYFCINEGEQSMTCLLELLQSGGRGGVPGMWATGTNAKQIERAALVSLDDLPPPDYDALPVRRYLEIASPRIFDLYAGTGCTYACSFCTTAPFWDRTFRAKSPPRIFDELEELHRRYGITQVNLLHDNFANKKEYLNNFLDYFIQRNTRYQWSCAIRPDNVNVDQLRRMKRAGCFRLFSGIDSGSSKILRLMKKLPNSSKAYVFFRACQEAEVQIETNTIIGYPDEDDQNLEDSLAIVFDAMAHGAVSSDVSVLQPLQGAPVTVANGHNLEYAGVSNPGAFFPQAVEQLVRSDLRFFSSYGFIRHDNRDFNDYARFKDFVRFFSRHFFRTLYFLKNECGQRYVDMFELMLPETDASRFPAYFTSVASCLVHQHVDPHQQSVAQEVLRFDAAIEQLKGTDISMEITNISHIANTCLQGPSHVALTLQYNIHHIFEKLPKLEAYQQENSHYLFFRNCNDVVTIKLSDRQLYFWKEMSEAKSAASDRGLSRLAKDLRTEQTAATIDLFASILGAESERPRLSGGLQ